MHAVPSLCSFAHQPAGPTLPPPLYCRFAARVQGAAQPFYTTAEEGEQFTLDQTHFCRAIATGELAGACRGFTWLATERPRPPAAATDLRLRFASVQAASLSCMRCITSQLRCLAFYLQPPAR